jgi:hypothetical protein
MDASYYRWLARDLVAHAVGTDDPAIAERLRGRAREYLVIAESLDESDAPSSAGDTPEGHPRARH